MSQSTKSHVVGCQLVRCSMYFLSGGVSFANLISDAMFPVISCVVDWRMALQAGSWYWIRSGGCLEAAVASVLALSAEYSFEYCWFGVSGNVGCCWRIRMLLSLQVFFIWAITS